jgi:murein DD-endopeptidase MepM/ murein hydrolase activator NlpD
MNVILLSNFCKKKGSIDICMPRAMAWLLPGVAAFAGLLFWAGFEAGDYNGRHQQADAETSQLQAMLRKERAAVEAVRAEQKAHLDALALRIGEMQARMMRVDALGDRLVGIGKLDPEEFDFSTLPPLGGQEEVGEVSQDPVDMDKDLKRLDALLQDREDKLVMIEEQLFNHELMHEVLPSGRPVNKGWISSSFGRRTDPFTGKRSYHRGIDFASKRGTLVHAVAAGVVKRARKVSGYGNLVEIRHVDGYSTLYGHNQKNLVKSGDVVTKGQVIALLGSTGRSSGPHVHFEVHKNGKIVDPKRYIRAP